MPAVVSRIIDGISYVPAIASVKEPIGVPKTPAAFESSTVKTFEGSKVPVVRI